MKLPGDDELIPLGWVRKWIRNRLVNVCAVVEKVPCRKDTEAHWQMVRSEARAALQDLDELSKLAAWLPKPKQTLADMSASGEAESRQSHPRRLPRGGKSTPPRRKNLLKPRANCA